MSGYGRFKSKFGGALVTLRRWHKACWRSARWTRKGYAFYLRRWLAVHAWLMKFSRASESAKSGEGSISRNPLIHNLANGPDRYTISAAFEVKLE
jgi:hypothetical protein